MIIAIIAFVLFFGSLFLITVFEPFTNLREWKLIYDNLDKFYFQRDTVLGSYLFSDGSNTTIMVDYDGQSCFVDYKDDVLLHSTNEFMSRKVAKKLIKSVPECYTVDKVKTLIEEFREEYENQSTMR